MMKKLFLVTIIAALACGLILGGGVQSVTAAEKDKYGGVLKWAISKSPKAFGYPPTIRAADQVPAVNALELLVLMTTQNVAKPYLATDWDISPDGKTFTFKLRKGVKFHDGTDFNAQAVKYNLDLWLETPGPVLNKMKSVDIVDRHTIRINFTEYDALVMYELAMEPFMVSPTAVEKNGKKWAETHPVGTGPFKLKKYERDVVVRYERFDDFWQKGRPYLDGMELLVIKNSMTQLSALKSGEIHGIRMVAREHAKMLEKEGYILSTWKANCIGIFGDSKNPDSIWANRKVREAIENAIDKETLMRELGLGYTKALYQGVLPDNPFYNPDLKPRMYDPEKAKKLLAEAGYPEGFKTTLTHIAPHWPASWVAIQGDLAKVGIDLKIIPVDRPKYLAIRFEGALKNGSSHIVAPLAYNYLFGVKNFLMSTAKHVPDMARPAGMDDFIKKALAEIDPEKQKALLMQVSKLLYDDVSFIPLNLEMRLFAFDKDVHDYVFGTYTMDNSESFTKAWIGKK